MIYAFFIALLIITSAVLVIAILMQAGKGGGLAANFGGAGSSADAFLGSRQATNVMTKISWVGGSVFLVLAFVLSLASTRPTSSQSALDRAFQTPPAQSPSVPAAGGTDAAAGGAAGGAAGSILKTAPPGDTGKAKAPGTIPPP